MTKPSEPPRRIHKRAPNTLTIASVTAALRASNGIRSHAAERLKVDRSCVTRFIQRNPDIEIVEREIVSCLVDMAEGKLHDAIRSGDFKAVRFYLANKGAEAGYGIQRVQLAGRDGGPIELKDVSHYTDEQLADLERAAGIFAGDEGSAT